MTKYSSKLLIVVLNGVEISCNDIISVELTRTGEKSESTGICDDWKTFLSDLTLGGTFTINGYTADGSPATTDSLREAVMGTFAQDDHAATCLVLPKGAGSGLQQAAFTLIIDTAPTTYDKAETSLLNVTGTINGAIVDTPQT